MGEVEIPIKINEVYVGVFKGEFTRCPISFLAYNSKERAIQEKGLLDRFSRSNHILIQFVSSMKRLRTNIGLLLNVLTTPYTNI